MKTFPRTAAAPAALGLWLVWTVATWWFEGRIETLLRPGAVGDRLVYALVVNLAIGTAGALGLVAFLIRRGSLTPRLAGFGPWPRTAIASAAGLALGFGAFVTQGPASLDPAVVVNLYAQALVVSTAEVVVCWALVAGVLLGLGRGRAMQVTAALAAAALFGLYHFAHSPPFNTWPVVAMLSGVGLATGVFFLASRDTLGTILFHNWLGVFGVMGALERGGALAAFEAPRPPLLAMAAVTLVLLLVGGAMLRRLAPTAQLER